MEFCNIHHIKALLGRHGFHFSKGLGQNFLCEQSVPEDIAAGAAGFAVELGVAAVTAGDGEKALVLVVEHAGNRAAGGVDGFRIVKVAAALGALILAGFLLGHIVSSPFLLI